MTTSIASEILALEELDTDALAAKYEELTGKPTKRRFPQYLRKRIAYALQEKAFGGLSRVARKRIEELSAEINLPLGDEEPVAPQKSASLTPGMSLTREWRGVKIEVHVREDGFEWEGQLFKSLSATANAITGTRWNGRTFFGLPKELKLA